MRLFVPLLACALGLAGPALAEVVITVDKSTQRMTVEVDGQRRHSWPVSTGLASYATPAGSYRAFRMEEDHYSKEWDEAPMPHSIFFTTRGHAIHGTDATGRLGRPASHGCIRLSRANAATLFDLVRSEGLGDTKVVVRGQEGVVSARKRARVREAARERPVRAAARRAPRGEAWEEMPTGSTRRAPAPGYYYYEVPGPY